MCYKITRIKAGRSFRLIVVFLFLLTAVIQGRAQDAERYSFSISEKTAGEVLHEFVLRTGIDLVYNPAILHNKMSSFEINEKTAKNALQAILNNYFLGYSRLPNGVYMVNSLPKSKVKQQGIRRPNEPIGYTNFLFLDKITGKPLDEVKVFIPGSMYTVSDSTGVNRVGLRSLYTTFVVSKKGYKPATLSVNGLMGSDKVPVYLSPLGG